MAVTHPVAAAVGAVEPQGKANTCHSVSVPPFVQVMLAESCRTVLLAIAEGSGQVGKSSIITLSMYNLQPSKPPFGTCQAMFTGPLYAERFTIFST